MTEKNERPSGKLHPSIEELLGHLNRQRDDLGEQIAQESLGLMPAKPHQAVTKEFLPKLLERRIREIEHFSTLLISSNDDPETQRIAEELNGVYREIEELRRLVPYPTSSAVEKNRFRKAVAEGDYEYQDAYDRRLELEGRLRLQLDEDGKADHINKIFRDILRKQHVSKVTEKMSLDTHAARREMMITSFEVYGDLVDQMLTMPKQSRDRNIAELEKSLLFYKSLANGEMMEEWAQRVASKAKELLEPKEGDEFRELLGKGKDKLQDVGQSILATIFGGSEESLTTYLYKKTVELERELSRPVEPDDPVVLEAIQKDIQEALGEIGEGIDESVVDQMLEACTDLRSIPDQLASDREKTVFTGKYRKFIQKVVLPTQEGILEAHSELLSESYQYSHGDEGSVMEADTLLRAKALQMSGRDVWRTLQVLSPFGIALPDEVELKPFEERFYDFERALTEAEKDAMFMIVADEGTIMKMLRGWHSFTPDQKREYFRKNHNGGLDKIKIKSMWDRGFMKDHPILSFTAQTTTLGLLVEGAKRYAAPAAYQVLRASAWVARNYVPVAGRFVPAVSSTMPAWVSPCLKFAGKVYIGYVIGDWINGKILGSMEEGLTDDIQEMILKYDHPEKIPEETKRDIRFRILRNELMKRRKYFQGIGYDLNKFGMDFWDRNWVGGGLDGGKYSPFRESMVESGAFREAVKAANFQLNMLGFENFTIE